MQGNEKIIIFDMLANLLCRALGNVNGDKTRQDKTRQDKTRQDKTRQDKTRQDKTRGRIVMR